MPCIYSRFRRITAALGKQQLGYLFRSQGREQAMRSRCCCWQVAATVSIRSTNRLPATPQCPTVHPPSVSSVASNSVAPWKTTPSAIVRSCQRTA